MASRTLGTVETANLAVVAVPVLAVRTPRRAHGDRDRGHPGLLPQGALVDRSRRGRVRGVCAALLVALACHSPVREPAGLGAGCGRLRPFTPLRWVGCSWRPPSRIWSSSISISVGSSPEREVSREECQGAYPAGNSSSGAANSTWWRKPFVFHAP